jgi:hypothetical protein
MTVGAGQVRSPPRVSANQDARPLNIEWTRIFVSELTLAAGRDKPCPYNSTLSNRANSRALARLKLREQRDERRAAQFRIKVAFAEQARELSLSHLAVQLFQDRA